MLCNNQNSLIYSKFGNVSDKSYVVLGNLLDSVTMDIMSRFNIHTQNLTF